jgi:DNA-binding NarL/FixJ family response regulator
MHPNCNILHLEDDENDSFLFQRALRHLRFAGTYRLVTSVDDAISYFSGAATFSDRSQNPLPDILVADSNLGQVRSTADFLAWMDKHPHLRPRAVVMLSGACPSELAKSNLPPGVDCLLGKGGSYDDIAASAKEVLRYCGGGTLV